MTEEEKQLGVLGRLNVPVGDSREKDKWDIGCIWRGICCRNREVLLPFVIQGTGETLPRIVSTNLVTHVQRS